MANELIYSAGDSTKAPIGINSVMGIYKKDWNNGTTIEYRLIFHIAGGQIVTWIYTAAADRDDAYSHIITQYGFDTD